MSAEKRTVSGKSSREPCYIVKERLTGTRIDLTSFVFHHGGNIYVFSYEKAGIRRHTFIDAGDPQYRNQLLPILIGNGIEPTNIERIILTHRHPDHCGLADLLAEKSGAKILAHSNFRSFIEGKISQDEQGWLGDFDLSRLRKHDIEYLSPSDRNEMINIHGLGFPRLAETIEIGEGGKLEILGCPASTISHSPDQIIVLYSPRSEPLSQNSNYDGFQPTDDILFSGDLWLMTGPLFNHGIEDFFHHARHGFNHIRNLMPGNGMRRPGPQEQDSGAKEALKKGFCLVRVKPGHGEEFIGSRIIPNGLLANSDMAIELGYPLDAGRIIPRSENLEHKTKTLLEQAYNSFVNELLLWIGFSYDASQISALLIRLYKEQSGGGPLVQRDRIERRERLKETLARLSHDETAPDTLRQLAESTLPELKRI